MHLRRLTWFEENHTGFQVPTMRGRDGREATGRLSGDKVLQQLGRLGAAAGGGEGPRQVTHLRQDPDDALAWDGQHSPRGLPDVDRDVAPVPGHLVGNR